MGKKAWRAHTSRSRSKLLTALDNAEVEINALRVIPDGADKPGLPIPDEIEYTPDDLERMAALWDKINPGAAGVMTSPVINRRDNAG